jgi:hypothetical protein
MNVVLPFPSGTIFQTSLNPAKMSAATSSWKVLEDEPLPVVEPQPVRVLPEVLDRERLKPACGSG